MWNRFFLCLGIALNMRISRHLKLLKESVPNIPICTCDTMQDLPLRSEYEQTLGMEKL